MENKNYKAFIVEKTGLNEFTGKTKENTINDLPDGDVIVRVKYSSLNYKDALSAKGNKAVTRNYPHTPGIDASGVYQILLVVCSNGYLNDLFVNGRWNRFIVFL